MPDVAPSSRFAPCWKRCLFLREWTTPSAWFASACSLVTPGELVAAGGEPRGGAIKVVIGILILGLVVSWALRRRARGARPSLPGPP